MIHDTHGEIKRKKKTEKSILITSPRRQKGVACNQRTTAKPYFTMLRHSSPCLHNGLYSAANSHWTFNLASKSDAQVNLPVACWAFVGFLPSCLRLSGTVMLVSRQPFLSTPCRFLITPNCWGNNCGIFSALAASLAWMPASQLSLKAAQSPLMPICVCGSFRETKNMCLSFAIGLQ